VAKACRLFRQAQAVCFRLHVMLCVESLPGLRQEIGCGPKPSHFIVGEALTCRRGDCEGTQQTIVGRLERIASIGLRAEETQEGAVRVTRDALLAGYKRLVG
jgi:hypothetical protein